MDRAALKPLSRDQLIELVEQLAKRVGELEAKLGLPKKTPENSSLPPSQGHKPSGGGPARERRRKGRPGRARALDPAPTRVLELRASSCRAEVSGAAQAPCESYDHIDIPPVH